MSARQNADPFYLVKDGIETSLDKAKTLLTQWQTLSRSSPERYRLQTDVEDECKSIAWQLDEMGKAVDVAERQKQRFGLTQQEVIERRKWVHSARQQCEQTIAAVHAPATAKVAENGSATGRLGTAVQAENDRDIDREGDQQQLLLRQQDDDLDALGAHVTRIGQVGLQIHEELEQQSGMLEELDTDIEGTSTRLQAAQKKIDHMLKKAGLGGQLCIIVFLIAVLIILLVLVIQG